ncbi:hypothetical protein TKK_0008022 [Trichogramma kaykai]
MGWTTRGTGRTYDSLTGTAALIGMFSKKVISYATFNRKCKKYDLGHKKEDHDCRANYIGSAKGMEPQAAIDLVSNNDIFTKENIELGIFISDNDSTAIHGVRNLIAYDIVKQADKNHTTGGLSKSLYKIKNAHRELNCVVIKYLQRSFAAAISQNVVI